MLAGTIFNIQKYSIHDGPGIRTTVFFKGCPLACWWCHNPESLAAKPELVFSKQKCIGCGDCVSNCPNAAILFSGQELRRDKTKCSLCECCTESCPTGAMEKIGRQATIAEVMEEIEKDSVFYEQSGGGVTFSGGEALQQLEFLDGLLTACKIKGFHTALDTSGYAPWESIARIAEKVDLFLYDLKLMDDKKHRKYTGVSNQVILENLEKLSAGNRKIRIRVPFIPEVNTDAENMDRLCEYLSALKLKDVNLLPFHHIAADKYFRLGRPFRLFGLQSPSGQQVNAGLQKLQAFGLNVKIGG